jgi:hypothetical protein
MPPRGVAPQKAPYRPPASAKQNNSPGGRRRVFDIVIFLVVIAIAAICIKELSGTNAFATNPSPTYVPSTKKGATATGAPVVVTGDPVITELMPSNKGSVTDAKGDYTDWIEIYNPTSKAINLAGFALSDNLKKPRKSVLPSYMLDAGQYVIVYADKGQSTSDELHVSFKLKDSDQLLMLTDPNGNPLQQISYPSLQADHSYSLDMSTMTTGTQKWIDNDKYTPGFANSDDGYAAYQQTRRATAPITLSETMPGNTMTIKDADGDYSDWIEIYNPTDKAVDITGWGLSNRESEPKRWTFPQMQIQPKQYLVVFASGKNRSVAGKELHTSFRLNSFKDTVILSNLRGQIVSETQYDNMKSDTSWGLKPGTPDTWQVFTQPTPGQSNDEAGWNALQPKLYNDETSPVIIKAVMSNNATALKDKAGGYPDWIELYNRSNQSVSLSGYGLSSKSNKPGYWKFPDVSLSAGQYLTVFATGTATTAASTSTSSSSELDADFSISGQGSVVVLTTPQGSIADRCFVPQLQADMAYGRAQSSMAFSYITNYTKGQDIPAGYPGMSPDPEYSVKAGFYDKEQQISLSASDPDAKIYYTLNGDLPTKNSTPYTGPIDVKKPTKDFGATVIRAISYRDGYLPSKVATSSYFIGQNITLPVISITVDNKAMFDPSTGLYEMGPSAEAAYPFNHANFHKTGKNGEVAAHMEMFDPDNPKEMLAINQDIGLQMFGHYSRGDVFKGMEFIARSVYGKNSFDYQIFPDEPYTSFKSFVSKPGGQDVKSTGMRDMLTISLARDTIPATSYDGGPQVFTQDVRLALEFVNGEFWGVTTLHEKVDGDTFAQHYPGVDPNKIDEIDTNGSAKAGSNKDFLALVNYAKTHDLSIPENYKYVTDKMDVDSYINWYTLEIVCGNSDMANVRVWRSPNLDDKWHWIYYDFCWAFWPGFLDSGNARYMSDIHLDIEGPYTGQSYNKALVQALLKNPGFKDKFIKQLAYNINVTFATDTVLQRIDEISSTMKPYMAAEDAKWRDISKQNASTSGFVNWDQKVEGLRTYAKQHPALLKQEMKSYFNLSDAQMQQLFPNK